MGHLINATALRLGWTLSWNDQWYLEKPYYTDYLYTILRLRFYLLFIFSQKRLEKSSTLYSHFELIKLYKNIEINIYYYYANLEESFFNWKFDFFLRWYNNKKNKDPETRWSSKRYKPFKVLIFWYLFDIKLNYKNLKKKMRSKRIREWFKKIQVVELLKKDDILAFLSRKDMLSKIKFKYLYVWCYFTMYKQIMLQLSKTVSYPGQHHFSVLKRYFMFVKMQRINHLHTKLFVCLLTGLLSRFVDKCKIIINLYLIANENVTAKFLSRYIARKLQRTYTIKKLLKPLLKELRWVAKSYRMPKSAQHKLINNISTTFEHSLQYKRTIFQKIIKNIQKFFIHRIRILFVSTKNWFTLNLLTVGIWFNTIKNIYKYKTLFQYYFLNKSYFLAFFERSLDQKNNRFLPIFVNLNLKINVTRILGWLFDYFITNKWTLLHLIKYTIPDIETLKYSCINLNRYLKFQYWNFNYLNWSLHENNYLKSRITKYTRLSLFKGFKILFVGRFKRKQRASKYWISRGTVPLNTIKACIEYGYYTIPLINSAITVKVWIHRSKEKSNMYFQKIS